MALQQYIVQTLDLIRDTQGLFVTQNALLEYINEGRTQVALQTHCIQRFITGQPPFGAAAQPSAPPTSPPTFVPGGAMPGSNPQSTFATIPNQERYPFIGFANQYLNEQHAGLRGIFDVLSVSVSWGGAFRPALTWIDWPNFQAQLRATQTLVTNYPFWWSVFNDGEDGEIWMYPPPQSVNEMEWIVFASPAAIYTDDQFDAIPQPFRRGVKYYAAARAYEASQRFYNAQLMMNRFNEALINSRGAVDRGKIPSFYPDYV